MESGSARCRDRLGALALPLLDVAAAAAVRCHAWIGRGDKLAADQAAVEAMREALALVPGRGQVVIGEGEKDQAPMLYAGEEVGQGEGPLFDLAVDPLEGTNLCATGAAGAITVLAAAPRGALHALTGFYMDKIVVGPAGRGAIDVEASIEDNLARVARAAGTSVDRLRVAVLARPRHDVLMKRIRSAGASVVELRDGDVMAAMAALVPDGGIHMALGTGGAPEGVITACAARLLGGDMQGRLAPQSEAERERVEDAGELDQVYGLEDLVGSTDAVFVASGVTGCVALPGVEPGPQGYVVHSILITTDHGLLRVTSTVEPPAA